MVPILLGYLKNNEYSAFRMTYFEQNLFNALSTRFKPSISHHVLNVLLCALKWNYIKWQLQKGIKLERNTFKFKFLKMFLPAKILWINIHLNIDRREKGFDCIKSDAWHL